MESERIPERKLTKLRNGLPKGWRQNVVDILKKEDKRTVSPQFVSQVANGSAFDLRIIEIMIRVRDIYKSELQQLAARI